MESFFLRLVNLSITASWLVLAVLILRLIFRKAPKWIFCVLWGLLALRLACPISVESNLSLIPSAEVIRPQIMIDSIPKIQTDFDISTSNINPIITKTDGNNPMASTNPLPIHLFIGSVIWISGVAIMLIYAFVSYLIINKRVATATIFYKNIKQSERVDSPFVLGFFRPVIYLPYKINDTDLYYVIEHEKAHIRRKDHWWKPIGFVLLSIYWFNPLLWLAYILLCRDIEAACDEKVIKEMETDDRRAYSTALLNCSIHHRHIAVCPLAFGETGVTERVKRVMYYKKPTFCIIILVILSTFIVVVLFMTNPVVHGDTLKLIEQSTPRSANSFKYSIELGSKAMSGTIRAEQWSNGSCVQSAPVILTQHIEEIQILTEVRKENGSSVGVEIQIDADDNGSSLMTYFAFPEENSIMGWACNGYELNKEVQITPNSDMILAAMLFDAGNGVRVYDVETFLNEPSHLKNTSYAIVIRATFEYKILDVQGTDSLSYPSEISPGTNYVSWQCLYMNPLSSYAAIGGNSGCRYIVADDSFSIVNRSTGAVNKIDIPKWEWEQFPYTDDEWASLYKPEGFGGLNNISKIYEEILYQPLDDDKFLLRVDGNLWLVELIPNKQMESFIWSIYSLVPEADMGAAKWKYSPLSNSSKAAFRFEFDIEHTDISAVCIESLLMDLDSVGNPSDYSLIYKEGNALYWSPMNEDGNIVSYADIHFTVRNEDTPVASGTIYITMEEHFDERTYTASLVGSGLYLSTNSGYEGGGVITLSNR